MVSLSDEEYTIESLPEKHLCAAILERAYRDLDLEDSAEAVRWFRYNKKSSTHFTFEHIVEILELSERQLNKIKNKVKETLLREPKTRAFRAEIRATRRRVNR